MAGNPRKRTVNRTEWLEEPSSNGKRFFIPNTCKWIRTEQPFTSWLRNEDLSPLLWVNGAPGSGKTFLAQNIVEYITESNPRATVLSYFCDAYSTPASIARAFTAQLLRDERVAEEARTDIAHVLGSQPGLTDNAGFPLWEKLTSLSQWNRLTFIVIDGPDEMKKAYLDGSEFDVLDRLLQIVLVKPGAGSVRVLVSSRPEPHLHAVLKHFSRMTPSAEKVSEDMERFVSAEITRFPQLQPHREKIIKTICPEADGIFLWAGLAIKALAATGAEGDIMRDLDYPTLDNLYTKILQDTDELSPFDLDLRKHILEAITVAVRPLRVVEVMNAVLLSTNALILDFRTRAIKVCGTLVKIEDDEIKPIHFSLRDFLQKQPKPLQIESAHLHMTQACIQYLSHPAFTKFYDALPDVDQLLRDYPFLEYAALYWVEHFTASTDHPGHSKSIELVSNFFRTTRAAFFWADALLPALSTRSVYSLAPRPPLNARFLHLTTLMSRVIRASGPEHTPATTFLLTAYENALQTVRKTHGPTDPITLERSLHYAELCSWAPHQEVEAETLLTAVVSAAQPHTHRALALTAHSALADVYKRAARFADAQRLLEKVLYLAEEDDETVRLFALDGLGWVHLRQAQTGPEKERGARLMDAERRFREALAVAEGRYGVGASVTVRSSVSLAEVLSEMGRVEDAEELCATLKEHLVAHRMHGHAMPADSVSRLNALAGVLGRQGKWREAAETWEVVVKERRGIFGEEGRMTLGATMQLGIARMENGEGDVARETFMELLPLQVKVLGEHPDVAETKRRLEALGEGV